MSNPLVKILAKAIRDIGNRNGQPIAGYYNTNMKIEYYDQRAMDIHRLVANALAECPKGTLDEN